MPPKSAKSRHYSLSQQNSVNLGTDFTKARKKFTQTLFPSSYVFASLYTLYTNILVIIFILDILDAKLVHQVYLINLYNPEFSELKIFT